MKDLNLFNSNTITCVNHHNLV